MVPENIHTHTTGGISEFRREGGLRRLEFRGHGGVHGTGIPKAWGDFQESNFQFGVVKSLQEKLVKNDLSKDDDSLVNTGQVQLNQHAGDTFQWSPVRNQQICNRSATDLFCPKQINYRLIYYLHDLFSVCADEVNGSSATFFCLQT